MLDVRRYLLGEAHHFYCAYECGSDFLGILTPRDEVRQLTRSVSTAWALGGEEHMSVSR